MSSEFRGRLGYACINTVLRAQGVYCSRTCRLNTIKEKGIAHVKQLALDNIRDLSKMIEWNEQHHIRFMRISSDLCPFASHEDHGYALEFASDELRAAGDKANEFGHRLTMHPGQYTQLSSPRPDVVRRSIRELEYHAEIFERMGLDASEHGAVMVIHMGGVHMDKQASLQRFETHFQTLPPRVKAHLVLENDELCYSVEELLPVCERLDIPLILDWHHDALNPSSKPPQAYLDRIDAIWKRRGIRPKQHYSESRPGARTVMERRAHSDRVKAVPPCAHDMDLMIEAKEKEQAVFSLYRLLNLHPVDGSVYYQSTDEAPVAYKKRKLTEKKPVKTTLDQVFLGVKSCRPKRSCARK